MSDSASHHRVRAGSLIGMCVALACVFTLAAPVHAFAANVIYVNSSDGSDVSGTGSVSRPYKSIERGLAAASSGDCVRIAPGDYSAAATGETFPLSLPMGVRLQGTGSMYGTRITGDGAHPVISILNGNENTVVDGLLITAGGGVTGGAIMINGGSSPGWGPVIQRNIIGNNIVTGTGGAIASVKGAAADCSPTIRYNQFINNQAVNGGAIYAQQSTLEITGNVFVANLASSLGGGLFADQSPGGEFAENMLLGNEAAFDGGGAMFNNCGPVYVRDSIFAGCEADGGAGLYNNLSTSVWVENSIFWQNTGDWGAGAYCDGNTAFNLCTFIGNDAANLGDGIRRNSGTVMVSNSILWDNNGDDIEGIVTTSYSTIQEPTISGVGVIHQDPRLGDPMDPFSGLDRLSPCIDTGNPTSPSGHDFEQIARPQDGNGDGTVRIDMGALEYWLDVQRDAGNTRYSTATNMWGDRMPYTHYAVIATGLNFPDALCAAGLAGAYDAPILLTKTDSLPHEVVTSLEGHDIYEIFIVGGPDVVSPAVVAQLEDMDIDVTRLYGDTRYSTARAVADHLAPLGMPGGCFVARGDLFPDALAMAPIAWAQRAPVLLVKPDSVPSATRAALDSNGYTGALIGGDTTAVSGNVETVVESYVGAANVTRLGGATRYETAAEIASFAISEGWLEPGFFGIATGANFPDALAGGAVCGFEDGPLLLTKKDSLRSVAKTLMLAHQDDLREIYLFGGADVVGDKVMDDCRQLMP